MNIDVIDGRRPGTHLYHCHDGFYYHMNKVRDVNMGGVVIFLRCRNWSSRRCQGFAKIEVSHDQVTWSNGHVHTCPPDRMLESVLRLRVQVLQESVNMDGPFEAPAEIVNRVRERFPVEVAALVTIARMRSSISRARANLYPGVPGTLLDLGNLLDNNPHLTTTQEGGDSIYAGSVQGPGTISLIFISQRMKRYLSRTRIVSCDGTFGSRPVSPNSAQVLQIVGVVDNHVVPLVQVLMTGKTQDEYKLVLRHLQQLVPQFHPRYVLTDFERALQNSWRVVFNCHVYGCYWHFCRAVTIMTRQLGLTAYLRGNRVAKSIVRSLLAIPLLPQEIMERGLRVLITEATRRGVILELVPLFEYFNNTWFAASFHEALSVFRALHRTNNCAESANRMLRIKTGVHKPSLWHFLSALKKPRREP